MENNSERDEASRLECLRLASGSKNARGLEVTDKEILDLASRMFAFIKTGTIPEQNKL